jgi:hypothetical protein
MGSFASRRVAESDRVSALPVKSSLTEIATEKLFIVSVVGN